MPFYVLASYDRVMLCADKNVDLRFLQEHVWDFFLKRYSVNISSDRFAVADAFSSNTFLLLNAIPGFLYYENYTQRLDISTHEQNEFFAIACSA